MSCEGICVDTMTDPANCGGCGNTCADGQTCEVGMCSCGDMNVSFSAMIQPIFTASCASNGCHTGMNPAGDLRLTAGQSYAELIDVSSTQCNPDRKLVVPGQPGQSYLMDKLLGQNLCFGTVMPKGGALPMAQIQSVSDWICAGAPNN
jgi:hypothetical protein